MESGKTHQAIKAQMRRIREQVGP